MSVLYNIFKDNGDFNIPNYFDENYDGGHNVDWMRNSSPAIDLVSLRRNNNPRSPWTMINRNQHPKNLFDADYRPLHKGTGWTQWVGHLGGNVVEENSIGDG